MALGTADVRLIDMTRAYAEVGRGGVSVVPYGIRRVTTPDGTLLYDHPADDNRVLVPPWVAAQMTDLLAAVVEHGTGTNAQLGRPTAGKTGTTSSNKDGWFVGFSSGITTGVWMGRDDSRALAGLYGGRAPASAFHDFMMTAVANRAPEPFAIEAAAPDWQIDPDQEMWLAPPADNVEEPFVDEDGNPIGPPAPPLPYDDQVAPPIDDSPPLQKQQRQQLPPPGDGDRPPPRQRLDRAWLDRAIRDRPPPRDERRAPRDDRIGLPDR
jgi:penicillin-binding protein 1A